MALELKTCILSDFLFRAYRSGRLRAICAFLARRWEGGEFYSNTLRRIFSKYHGIEVGAYSYGACFVPGAFDRGVKVGRYVSIGPGVRVFLRNHPLDRLSLHPFFYNSALGLLKEDTISRGSLEIGHDAWIGANAIFTAGCSKIGIGAVIGAGAVVTRDVPDFAVVAGNPAKLIRYRFIESTRQVILGSGWWERSPDQCSSFMKEMTQSLGEDPRRHPLLSASKNAVKRA